MKRVDFDDVNQMYLKALVYGQPGSGKTTFGVSAPRPLILLSESQALPNIRDAARRMGRPRPATLVMESLDDYRYVIRAFGGDRGRPFIVRGDTGETMLEMDQWPESVVIDSITDVAELVTAEIRKISPQKTGKDGLPVDSERYWNVLMDRTRKLIRSFRDVPAHVLFLALLADKETGDGEEKTRWVGPQMPMRALPNVIMAAVNVVGITYRKRATMIDPKTGSLPMVYGIATLGPDYMSLKPYPPLRDSEVTDFSSWIARINGVDDGTEAPPPMDATAQVIEETAREPATDPADEQEPAKEEAKKKRAKKPELTTA